MSDKTQLVEILRDIKYAPFEEQTKNLKVGDQFTDFALETIAKALIAAGVLIPPCGVGDTIYTVEGGSTPYIQKHTVTDITYQSRSVSCLIGTKHRYFTASSFNSYVFTDKEEAQIALERRLNHE